MVDLIARLPKDLYPNILEFLSEYRLLKEQRKWLLIKKLFKNLDITMKLSDMVKYNFYQHYLETPDRKIEEEREAIYFVNTPKMWSLIKRRYKINLVLNQDAEIILQKLIISNNINLFQIIYKDLSLILPRIKLSVKSLQTMLSLDISMDLIIDLYSILDIVRATNNSINSITVQNISFILGKKYDPYFFYQSAIDNNRNDIVSLIETLIPNPFFLHKKKTKISKIYQAIRDFDTLSLEAGIKECFQEDELLNVFMFLYLNRSKMIIPYIKIINSYRKHIIHYMLMRAIWYKDYYLISIFKEHIMYISDAYLDM